MDVDSFPLYRRQNDGRFVMCGTIKLDNRRVVPYNKYFLLKYRCHINLEVCGTISAVKYLYKYVYKGATRASIRIFQDSTGETRQVADEIDAHLDARYVCAPEAAHRLLEYKVMDRNIAVDRLPVHAPQQQAVIYRRGHEAEAATRAERHCSKLEAWFEANRQCYEQQLPDGSLPSEVVDTRDVLYHEMPERFIFNSGAWRSRRVPTRTIGRMYFVSPFDKERFAMRLLLLYRKGVTSFDDLRTINGCLCATYTEAAKSAGFLHDDLFYEESISEAAGFHSATQLRSFFATLLAYAEVNNAERLWMRFLDDFCEDFVRRNIPRPTAESMAYYDVADRLEALGRQMNMFMCLPYIRVAANSVYIDREQHRRVGEEQYAKLNERQKVAADAVLSALEGDGGLFFIDGPGGSGKTFLYSCLSNLLIGQQKDVLCVAWTGIAANLLPFGRTVASTFKLNVENKCRSYSMKLQSSEAKEIAETSLLIWDEAAMAPKDALETVDTFLRDVTENHQPFGGKVVLLGGDFRQVLPVVDKGGIEAQVAACIKKSPLWPKFKVFRLTANMRVNENEFDWKKYVLDIGDGKIGEPTGEVQVPQDLQSTGNLLDEVFGNVLNSHASAAELSKVAILTPKNADALKINIDVLNRLPGAKKIFRSIDEAITDSPSDSHNYTTEFLNAMTPSGMPPHELHIKSGAIVMLIRNLDVTNGLCNGTRLVVDCVGQRVLKCKFVCGSRLGESVLIPRIDCYFKQDLPFTLRRRQFPIRLSFAMTINKAQGQTFDRIGLCLNEKIFSHGQLYVALSRVSSKNGIHVVAKDNIMHNIVYKDVL